MSEDATDPVTRAEQMKRCCEQAERPRRCVFCSHSRVWFNGWRVRSATILGEDDDAVHVAEIRCRRVKCADCKESWTLRPPDLTARRHYQLCVIARASSQYLHGENATLASVGRAMQTTRWTVSRWIRWMSAIAEPEELGRRLLETVGAPILPRAPAVLRRLSDPERQSTLVRAASVLSLMEALGQALGLQPPGLRAVVQAAIGALDRIGTYACPLIPALARGSRKDSTAMMGA